jgi:hypothetical protein
MADYKALLALVPIASALQGRVPVARASMMGIDSETGKEALPEHAFQWWPESFSDNIEIGWEPKQVPGASHAIMQWNSNGGRTFSFDVLLYRNMEPLAVQSELSMFGIGALLPDPNNDDNARFNINIEYMVSWLRSFCYPRYVRGTGLDGSTVVTRVVAPPIAILNLPNMALNEDGGDTVFGVMTACDVNYEKLFPNGQPRAVKVSVTIKQVVQDPQQSGRQAIRFKGYPELGTARKGAIGNEYLNGKPKNQKSSNTINPIIEKP